MKTVAVYHTYICTITCFVCLFLFTINVYQRKTVINLLLCSIRWETYSVEKGKLWSIYCCVVLDGKHTQLKKNIARIQKHTQLD